MIYFYSTQNSLGFFHRCLGIPDCQDSVVRVRRHVRRLRVWNQSPSLSNCMNVRTLVPGGRAMLRANVFVLKLLKEKPLSWLLADVSAPPARTSARAGGRDRPSPSAGSTTRSRVTRSICKKCNGKLKRNGLRQLSNGSRESSRQRWRYEPGQGTYLRHIVI